MESSEQTHGPRGHSQPGPLLGVCRVPTERPHHWLYLQQGGGAALIVPVSQPRKLRPREGKPPTKATQQGSSGVGVGALALCL